MKINDILTADSVAVLSSCGSKKRLFAEIADLAAEVHGLESGAVREALLARETLGPTCVGSGVALPHARIDELSAVKGLFLKLETPIDFRAIDRRPVDLVFALFAPESAGVDHLRALALVSRTLRNDATQKKLRANGDRATLFTVLTEEPAVQAA